MKKISLLLIIFLTVIGLTGCGKEPVVEKTDGVKFKEEYEKLNDVENSNGLKHRVVNISEDNPFIYSSGDEIVKKIENGDTFYVYFGSSYCPWCRSVIEKFIEVSNEQNIKEVYYVNIWANDHEEILRDTYKLNDKGKPEKTFDGDESYAKLLEYMDNVLGDYTLTDSKGKSISVGEKRIFAPNFIYVENGKSIKLVEGTSDKQKDSREELTEEMLADEEKIFNDFFKKN